MEVNRFYFGVEDARYLRLKREEDKISFAKSFVLPRGFDIDDFLEGRRYFISGPKGSGKTALLQYIRLFAEVELSATVGFYYFQSSFRTSELKRFKKVLAENKLVGDELVSDPDFFDQDEIPIFWRLFIFSEVSRLLKRAQVKEGAAEQYHKTVEALKLIASSKNVGRRYPSLESFHARLARDPHIEVNGSFNDATPQDLDAYLALAEEYLDDVYLENSPVFLFIDEMEVYRKGDETDQMHFSAVGSLVQAIRDFNERFSDSDIRVIAAVRSEVVDAVSIVQNEIHRVVNALGVKLGWNETVRGSYHPLEQVILKAIAAQDPDIAGTKETVPDSDLHAAFRKYFKNDYSLNNALDLTWYRPRDISLLFEIAQSKDRGQTTFRPQTLRKTILPDLGERMLQDAKAGLGVKYLPSEIEAFDRILRGGKETYDRSGFLARLEELADQYDDVAVLADRRWIELLEDLYRVGVIYTISKDTGRKNFGFRGDPMPSFTEDFEIGVHQSLLSELSIVLPVS